MAKNIENVQIFLTSANGGNILDTNSILVKYKVCNNDLSKTSHWNASGIDFGQSVSGFFDSVISEIEIIEGI